MCGYVQGQDDQTLFFRHSPSGKRTNLIVYVEDIIITGDDIGEMDRLKKTGQEFEVKDLGNLKYFLVMGVARTKK